MESPESYLRYFTQEQSEEFAAPARIATVNNNDEKDHKYDQHNS
jgi:hypothetical protein